MSNKSPEKDDKKQRLRNLAVADGQKCGSGTVASGRGRQSW